MSIIFYICILIFIFTPKSNFRCTQNGGWRAEKADKRRRTEGMIGMKTEKERGSSYKLWSDHEGLQSPQYGRHNNKHWDKGAEIEPTACYSS